MHDVRNLKSTLNLQKTPPGSSPDHRGSPQPGSSSQQSSSSSATLGLGDDFRLNETESFLNNLPPDLFGKYVCVVKSLLALQILTKNIDLCISIGITLVIISRS